MSIVVIGASGFVGSYVVRDGAGGLPIKALVRSAHSHGVSDANARWLVADLRAPEALAAVLDPGDIVLNTAYVPHGDEAENRRLLHTIVEACLLARAGRLVHCSTAVVAGRATEQRVTETTPCEPFTPYERAKWALEQDVTAAVERGLDAAIVRPTAIVGPGGQNLRTLASALQRGNRVTNYLRASAFGRRPMHLVPVRNVAAAMVHVALLPGPAKGSVYIVSSDDDPQNNFRDVEALLAASLGLSRRRIPPLRLPVQVLRLLVRARGRSETSGQRCYDSSKLRATGFNPPDTVAGAVRVFAASLATDPRACI